MATRPKINPLIGIWAGRTVALIASGPSLTPSQIEYLAPRHAFGDLVVAGVNDAYRICPFLDLLYAADERWWDLHHNQATAPIRATYIPGAGPEPDGEHVARYNLVGIPGRAEPGLSPVPDYVHLGQHSGFQLINLTIAAGAARILLLGFDCRLDGDRRHWFGDHPAELNRDSPYNRFRYEIEYAAPAIAARGVQVVNCSPGSALTCFPIADLAAALE